jgi:hypothetical protein
MRFVSVVAMVCSFNAFAVTDKNPEISDISIRNIVETSCAKSGYFNTMACEEDVMKCYSDFYWPKSVRVELKLSVVQDCVDSFIKR